MKTALHNSEDRRHAVDDPFLYDTEDLHAIASTSVVRMGLQYFRDGRVMDLHWEDEMLCARVEGSRADEPYFVELNHDERHVLQARCECGFEEEPICKHAVAVLYSYADQVTQLTDIKTAKDAAIEERSKRGRSEVKVRHVSGEPWFGTWQAQSIVSATHREQRYTVHIRSLQGRSNYCSCPDLATNQLGTCKHIEAVLHKIRKRRDYKKIKDLPPPFPFAFLAWDVAAAPQIKLQRIPGMSSELDGLLSQYFDAGGLFKGRLPDHFFRFTDEIYGRLDIHVGEDAQLHVRRLAADASHRLRARRIREQITRFGGQLPGIRARLYPYQVEGVAFLAATGRALLADDMGLGKTLQAICAASWLTRNDEIERVLVVCPASLKHQWAREIKRFTGHEAQVVQGGPETRYVQYRKANAFVVVNYELVLRDLSVINETLRPDLLVLDEAQRIKNWRTKIASSIKLIPSRYAFVLSGTPLENRLEDLYSLLQVVDGRVLGPLWRYMIDFHVTDDRDKVIGYRNLSELRRRIAPVMLRRDRQLVRDQLPDRIEQRLDIPMSAKQIELHDSALNAAGRLAQIAKTRPLTPSEQNRLMASLQQARMACDAAGLVDKESAGSPKLEELEGLFDELCLQQGLKVVVFSEWERMTALVEEQARRLRIGCVRLHGGVPTAKRGELMDRFREDDAIQVFISTDAGGTGLNLQSASVLINLDMPWNPAVLEQRIARVHRLGQTNKVQVVHLVAADSYEERVVQLIRGKRELFINVISSDGTDDSVGVSKKLLDSLVEDLVEDKPRELVSEVSEPSALEGPSPEPSAEAVGRKPGSSESEADPTVQRCIAEIQSAFGSRIERIVGIAGGLLVVMDEVDTQAERVAQALSQLLPVALIEPGAFQGLQRLGVASSGEGDKTYYKAGEKPGTRSVSPFLSLARQKLEAAEVLIERRCATGAAELLSSSMLSAAAAKASLAQIPSAEQAGVWIYAEAIPAGIVTADEAAALTRAISLSKAPSIPESLLYDVLGDARAFAAQAQ